MRGYGRALITRGSESVEHSCVIYRNSHLVIKHQQLGMGVAGDSRQFRCRGMECSKVVSRRSVVLIGRVDHRIVVHLMQEQVTTIAGSNNGIGGGSVARDDHATVGRVEAVSERL